MSILVSIPLLQDLSNARFETPFRAHAHPHKQLGFNTVPANKPNFHPTETSHDESSPDYTEESDPATAVEVMQNLHTLLLATEVREGKMVCGNCGHEYKIKEGIANFLLPSHLGESCLPGCDGSHDGFEADEVA